MKLNGDFFKKKWVPYTVATCSAVVLYMILNNLGGIFQGFSGVITFIKPIIIGIIIAYVFNPLSNFLEKKPFSKIKNEKTRWTLSVIIAMVVIILCVTLLCVALIPQLAESISTLFSNMDGYLASLQELFKQIENGKVTFFSLDLTSLADLGDRIVGYISSYFTDNMGNVVKGTSNLGKGVVDLALALILAIYFLLDKHRIMSGCQKLLSLIVKESTYTKTTEYLQRCNDITIKYISVDLIDGIAVGVLNFIFMLIMKMPYAVLISVIVGVTNLAPTFGPLIGAVIGGFILVLVNPWMALWFLIFTIVLQTVDGYILKPKLFGDSLGVSSLMILISIILGGRLFGVIGILIAIPFAAILDFTWRDFVIKKLEERHAKRYNIE